MNHGVILGRSFGASSNLKDVFYIWFALANAKGGKQNTHSIFIYFTNNTISYYVRCPYELQCCKLDLLVSLVGFFKFPEITENTNVNSSFFTMLTIKKIM